MRITRSFSLKMVVNSHSFKCRNQVPGSLSQDRLPLPPPLQRFIHARNVNSYRAVKRKPFSLLSRLYNSEGTSPPTTVFPPLYCSRSSILKLWMDFWAVGFSGSCCHGFSTVIGSAWLINGGHCRWTPFSTHRHYFFPLFFFTPLQIKYIGLYIDGNALLISPIGFLRLIWMVFSSNVTRTYLFTTAKVTSRLERRMINVYNLCSAEY